MHSNTKSKQHKNRGFSLVEMMVVIAIFGFISSIILFNHGKNSNETTLTNMAYEMALSIREAQIYGVSVRKGEGSADFDIAYGIFIDAIRSGTPVNTYILFNDTDDNNRLTNASCTSGECVTTYTLQRGITIDKIWGLTNNGCRNLSNTGLNISFERPEPEAIFYNIGNGARPANYANSSQFQIDIKSTDNSVRHIIISNNGQISVDPEPLCPST